MSDQAASISIDRCEVGVQRAVEGGLRTFGWVAAGQFVSIFGSSLTAIALGIWVYQQSESVTLLSLVILAASAPGVLISPLAGTVVDRFDRRMIMIVADCVSGLAELGVAIAIFSGYGEVGLFFVLATIISLADAFQEPAYVASVPLLVPKRHLGRASGLVQLSQGIARVVTPALAGLVLATAGIGAVLTIDLMTFAVAMVILSLVRIPRPEATDAGSRSKGSLWREAAEGWRYLCDRRGLVALLILFSCVNALVALVNVLYIPLVLSFASEQVLGVTLTVSGVGMLAGGVVVTALGVAKHKVRAIMGLLFCGGLAIGLTGVWPSAVPAAAFGFGMMFVLPPLQATSQVLWQTKVAADMQGRVFALRRMLQQAALPVAYLAAGPLADRLFEPLMAEGGSLAAVFGPWIGVGPGRGIGLLFVSVGVLGCGLALAGMAQPRIRHLERELPDMIGDTTQEASPSMRAEGVGAYER